MVIQNPHPRNRFRAALRTSASVSWLCLSRFLWIVPQNYGYVSLADILFDVSSTAMGNLQKKWRFVAGKLICTWELSIAASLITGKIW
jgi:hypothetical protein